MKHFESNVQTLKDILENIHQPERLNSHLWADALFVKDVVARHPYLQEKQPGEQILAAVAEVFRSMMPASPPKRGVRLDARWSEFGFLAAKYFAPILFGTPIPSSFQEAWERVDQSILLFVYGKSAEELSLEETQPYELMKNELQVTPISTMSDWHKKGLQRLSDNIKARENSLSASAAKDAEQKAGSSSTGESSPRQKNPNRRVVFGIICLAALLIVLVIKVWRVYHAGMAVLDDVNQLRESVDIPPSLEELDSVGPILENLQRDMDNFHGEARPLLIIAPAFRWVPKYGCDLASAPELLDLANALIDASVDGYQSFYPLLQARKTDSLTPSMIVDALIKANPQLSRVRDSLSIGRAARDEIDETCLSSYTRDALVNKIDPALELMESGVTVAMELPRMAGATEEGPKTYLLLAQNEDELRPTGGFITAAGLLLAQDGQIRDMSFTSSGYLDNWSKPYPSSPWQLRQYMNSPVLIFRDANWFTNYPKAALYAEYLYSYANNHSVDGVIAFDQRLLVEVLGAVGPINLEGVEYPIDANNIISYMRASKVSVYTPDGWVIGEDKEFLNKIAAALVKKILSGDLDWEQFISAVIRLLDERHLLVQIDDPSLTALLARRGWDGAVRPGDGDFLMAVDSNIGFNKTNAVVITSMTYTVDIKDPSKPVGELAITHQNNASDKVPCIQLHGITVPGQKDYPIDNCYWDYLRVYTKPGAALLWADPQSIPADWMIRRQAVPAQVDNLSNEEIEGVQAFGALKVVPGGQTITTTFRFALPAEVLNFDSGTDRVTYRLKIQKQPGTLAVPFVMRVFTPLGGVIQSAPASATIKDNLVSIQTDLRVDREFEIIFSSP